MLLTRLGMLSAIALTALVSVAVAEEKVVCHESPRYLIVEGSAGRMGTSFLVKYKSEKNARLACEYIAKPGDFEIADQWPEFFLELQDDLLILDSGTGPDPRGLVIWDLKKQQKVYSGSYSKAKIGPGYMEFWTTTGDGTDENCPEGKEWREMGLGTAIETWVRLSFVDFKLTKSSQTRCDTRQ